MQHKVFMNDEVFTKKGYSISTDKSLLNKDLIYDFLDKKSYWARGISLTQIETSIENSLCFGIYFKQEQVGFARVITDKSTFAYLADVFILHQERKKGLSKWLLQTIMNHHDLANLRRWMLATADAQNLYTQFGFELITHPERFMQIVTPYNTKK